MALHMRFLSLSPMKNWIHTLGISSGSKIIEYLTTPTCTDRETITFIEVAIGSIKLEIFKLPVVRRSDLAKRAMRRIDTVLRDVVIALWWGLILASEVIDNRIETIPHGPSKQTDLSRA